MESLYVALVKGNYYIDVYQVLHQLPIILEEPEAAAVS